MNTRKFLISAITAAAMVGLMVCPAFAAEADGAAETETIVINEDTALTLDNREIDMTDVDDPGPAILVTNGATLNLTIEGENTLKGSAGYAGICVELGCTLTITGSGDLCVYGGDGMEANGDIRYSGAGAGIGGNGNVVRTTGLDEKIDPSLGKVTISLSGGTINAYGGNSTTANAGAAAGIGSGGGSGSSAGVFEPEGTITINSGTINAYGGKNNAGGAGIGTGGYGNYGTVIGYVEINISGGTINAKGGNEAAGIGGGSNVTANKISISGGTVVATGGDDGDGSAWGGAGIGGGDNGGALGFIEISGTATNVTATGNGAAAGIGGGHNGQVYDILISDTATVRANGGTSNNAGGAGIGAGGRDSEDVFVSDFNIALADNANVTAVGGAGAQGIGVGTNPNKEDDSMLTISETAKLTAVSQSMDGNIVTALWGITENGLDESLIDTSAHLVWFNGYDATSGTANEWYEYEVLENAYNWTYTDGIITITNGDETVAEVVYPIDGATTVDSWAITLNN